MLTANGKNICNLCFEQLPQSGRCVSCDCVPNIQKVPGALREGVVLAGRYAVGKVLGKGGFGITYLCYDLKENKAVAIKEYLPDTLAHRDTGMTAVSLYKSEAGQAFKDGATKFYEEAKLLSRFNGNPNIISVYEFFYENNTAYFVMEYLRGVDLKSYIAQKNGRLPEGEAIYIFNRVCEALLIVHSTGILHRDISPDNIFICEDGAVKLLDFGAARQVVGEASKSLSIILKQGFAPLEQYQKKGNQGPWTDIYALGSTLYYSLMGKIPDDAMSRLDDPVLDTTGISPAFVPILNKMMEVKLTDRYQSIPELKMAMASLGAEVRPVLTGKVAYGFCCNCGKKIPVGNNLCDRCKTERTAQRPVAQPVPQSGQPMAQRPMTQSIPQSGQPMTQSIPQSGQPMTQSIPQSGQPMTQSIPQSGQPMTQSIPQSGQPMTQSIPQSGQPMTQSIPQSGQPMTQDVAPQPKKSKKLPAIFISIGGAVTVLVIVLIIAISAGGKRVDVPYDAHFADGRALYMGDEGLYGYIDSDGKVVVDFMFEDACDFSDGYAAVMSNDMWGYIDITGNYIVYPQYEQAEPFKDGLAIVSSGGKLGLVNSHGTECLAPGYDEIGEFNEDGFAQLKIGSKVGLVNNKGMLIADAIYDEIEEFDDCDMAMLKQGDLYGFVSKTGEIIAPEYGAALNFHDGLAAVRKDSSVGFIDTKGNLVVPMIYERVWNFSEGMACVVKNGKCGFVNTAGELVIDCVFTSATEFKNGRSTVNFDGRTYKIDKTGTYVGEAD